MIYIPMLLFYDFKKVRLFLTFQHLKEITIENITFCEKNGFYFIE